MKALLLKDVYVLIKQLKFFLIMIPIISLTSGTTMSAFVIFLGAALPMTAIAYDERSRWNELATMMPYTKFDITFSKYLLSYICIVFASVLSIAGQFLGNAYVVNAGGSLQIMLITISAALIFVAINTPMYLMLGSDKARFLFIGVMGLISASGIILQNDNLSSLIKIISISPIIFICIAVLFNILSVFISLRYCKRKN